MPSSDRDFQLRPVAVLVHLAAGHRPAVDAAVVADERGRLPAHIPERDVVLVGVRRGRAAVLRVRVAGVQHGNRKFQYGPVVRQVAPPLNDSYTSSSPRNTCLGFAGSTPRNWLYQACTPGWYAVKYRPTCGTWALSADPELASFVLSAILFQGPGERAGARHVGTL